MRIGNIRRNRHLVHSSSSCNTFGRSKVVDLVAVLLLVLPQGQVLLKELNDTLGITEIVLLEFVNLVESILEGLVSELAGGLMVLHDFVVEDGEVEGETELDGIAGGKGDLVSFVVGLEGVLLDLLHEGTFSVLSDVAVVVADHLDEESFGLTVASLGEHLLVDHVNDTLAVSGQLVLDLGFVVAESRGILGVLGVLLNGGNSAASGSLGADEVLESHG
jgi:hypothetical protein